MLHHPSPLLVEQLPAARRSLRLAVVTETYPPEVNGVALTAARFVDGLRERGHQIQLIRPRQDEADRGGDEEVLVRGLAIPRYPNLKMGLPAKRELEQLWTVRRPDLVHIVTEGPLGWSALRAALKLRLPVISDFRTNFHAYSSHYGIGWLKTPILAYLRKFHNRTLRTLVPTEALRAELAALGFRRVEVIARGVDTKLFNPARRSGALRAGWGASPLDPVMLHVGRIAPEKNIPVVVAAFEKARRLEPRAKLVLVGDGPARSDLQARYPHIVFAGQRSGEDLAAHYASGDMFLFASLTETYGNVTLEAMASGLAVVAFDYAAAAAHIRHGIDGQLANCGDEKAFIAEAAGLAGNASRIRRLAASARLRAEPFGWDRVVQELESVMTASAATDAKPARYSSGSTGRLRRPMAHST